MSSQTLAPNAEYGRLAFDAFIMQHWDDTSPESGPDQWASLARRYLALTPLQRFPYHRQASQAPDPLRCDSAPSPEWVARVLAPHQTTQERNASARRAWEDAVWLRVWYGSDNQDDGDAAVLTEAYEDMARQVARSGEMLVQEYCVFEDAGRYAANDASEGVEKLVHRAPELVDLQRHPTEALYLEEEAEKAERAERIAQGQGRPEDDVSVSIIYVLDKEALHRRLIKVCFVDNHGGVMRWNWLRPDAALEFHGMWFALAGILSEVLEVTAGEEEGSVLEV